MADCVDVLFAPLQRRRGSRADPITEDDVIRAIDKLQVLGGGFSIMKVSFCTCLRSCYSMAHSPTWRLSRLSITHQVRPPRCLFHHGIHGGTGSPGV